MGKISEGPWTVGQGKNSKSVHTLMIEGGLSYIATVHGSVDCAVDWYPGASHLAANARLIAASPVLLKALISARDQLQALMPKMEMDEHGNGPCCTDYFQALLDAGAAIEMATGESV